MVIGRCQRSDDVVEPRLKTQWFVRTAPLAAAALEATRCGRTRILPERFEKVWEHWMTNIRDWNVSRQLWWGHRIPAWYCPDGHATVSAEIAGPPACEVCGAPGRGAHPGPGHLRHLVQLRAVAVLHAGLAGRHEDLRRFYPGSVMETGYDIIFFWVARMMMLGIELTGEAPFHTVYLSGLIRDPYGAKMSKTKGNTVDPLRDDRRAGRRCPPVRPGPRHHAGQRPAVRAGQGRERPELRQQALERDAVRSGRAAGVHPRGRGAAPAGSAAHLGPAERWVLSRAAATTAAVDRAMADYGFGEVTRLLYDAIWNEFCDWGLELAKVRLADASLPEAEREATWWALVEALDTYLRLLHPVMPFITERLWQALPHRATDPELLIVARWPGVGERDLAAEAQVGALVELVRAVRNARADAKLEPGAWLPLDVYVEPELGHALEALRPGDRAARPREAAPPPSHPRGPARDRRGGAAGSPSSPGPAEAVVGSGTGAADPAAAGGGPRAPGEGAGRRGAAPRRRPRPPRQRGVHAKAPPAIVEGARAREAELADQVDRLRRPARPLAVDARRARPAALAAGTMHGPILHAVDREDAVPLEFLKRKGDADKAATPPPRPAAPSGLPEEVVAQDFQLKLYYAGKSTRGRPDARRPQGAWPSCRGCSRA